MANIHRNKVGMLEMRSEGAFKRSKWKACNVKVSSSTYLLYFKGLDNLAKPDGMVLLNNVTKVDLHSSKDVAFSFEVHFKNTKTSPGSPWIFNTISNDERIEWMEAIKPGSAQLLKQMLSNRSSLSSPPPPTMPPEPHVPEPAVPPLPQAKPRPSPRHRSDPQVQPLPQRGFATLPSNASSQLGHSNTSAQPLEHSLSNQLPQDYVEPNAFPMVDPSESLPVGLLRSNGHPPPPAANRSNRSSYSHKPRQNHPKLENKSSSERSLPPLAGDHYEVMDPAGAPQPPSPAPRPSKPKIKPRKKATPESSPAITKGLDSPPSADDDILGDENDTGYLSLIDNVPLSQSIKTKPPSDARELSIPIDAAEQLMEKFNKDQLGALIQMLQQVQSGGETPVSPLSTEPAPESSLRGNFKRALSHAPSELTSEKMLVTEEDDDESYVPRPDWAKAVSLQGMRAGSEEGQLDTLSALQEDALTIFREDIDEMVQIGEGQFGKVFRGKFRRGMERVEVAVKTTKITSRDEHHEEFLKEMRIMSQLMHPNIVRLYGLVQRDVPAPWIVLEYLTNGDLKSFLSKNSQPLSRLVKYMVDVSMGMHYLSEKGLVHRDLAARNILVSEEEVCKVADFGLLRELPKDDSFYHMQTNVPCPVRWMPPESISDRNFSTASDVWSFGVLIWEMFNPTKTPYTNLGNIEVATKVIRGYRLPTPRCCPPVIARIMKACWHDIPEKRPSFLLVSTLLTTRVTYPPEPTVSN